MDEIISIFNVIEQDYVYRRDLFNKKRPYYYTLKTQLERTEVIYETLSENEKSKIQGKIRYIKERLELCTNN